MNLNSLFYPQSIAVIGASSRKKTVGNDVVKNLVEQGYQGQILPVNPKIDELYGLPVYADISQVDREIDLAIVAIPAKIVAENLAKAAAKGVKAAAVISAGFKEVGNKELEQELVKVCRDHGITLVGPNCLGVINPEISMNASFAHVMPSLGSVAFVSQSGALCTAVLDYARELNLGFSKFLSIGNKADINELKLVKYLLQDDQTDVILIYSEDLQDAPAFIQTLKKHNRGPHAKPIIILKSGRTEAGAQAVASHTGSLAGGDNAYQALFDQAGMVRAGSVEELFNYAQVFVRNQLQPINNAAIITNAGGPGVLTTDELTANGVKLAALSKQTKNELSDFLPAAANVNNPVDILGDAQAEHYQFALQQLLADDQVDAILVVLTPQSMTEIQQTAQVIIEAKNKTDKPIVVSFMGGQTVQPGIELMQQADIATVAYPEPGAKALTAIQQFMSWSQGTTQEPLSYQDVDYQQVEQIINQALQAGQDKLLDEQALQVLQSYQFPTLSHQVVTSAQQAADAVQQIGRPCAIKIISPDIVHKTDVGGVILNVKPNQAAAKYQQLMSVVADNKPQADLQGALLMEMAPEKGVELALGTSQAPGLGSLIMVGLGGIFVELIKDVQFAYAPITKPEAQQMLSQLRSAALLTGFRNQPPVDLDAIIDCMGRLSQLVTDFSVIKELDINPLLALPQGKGVKVLDIRIMLDKPKSD